MSVYYVMLSSNTAVSFVDTNSIQVYRRRSQEKSWNRLSDLVSTLPYPHATALAQYVSCDPDELVAHAREFIEAALALGAYAAYSESCIRKGRGETRVFHGFSQRSIGPLWKLLQDSLRLLGKNAELSAPFHELLTEEFYDLLNSTITFLSQEKHGKGDSTDTVRPVQIFANISQKVFDAQHFGYFAQVQKQRFAREYEGRFIHAHGTSPFLQISTYRGTASFSQDQAIILDPDKKSGFSLEPLVFWEQCAKHPDLDSGHCFLYDKEPKPGVFSFKAAGFTCHLEVSKDGPYALLAEQLTKMKEKDLPKEMLDVGALSDITEAW